MEHKIFIYDKIRVFYKHTDFCGCVHPYNFYEWTSYAREAFFQDTVSNFSEVASRDIKMMTTKICLEVLSKAAFGDTIEARLTVGKIKKVSFDMFVRFMKSKTSECVARTKHTVVFVDSMNNEFAPIPSEMQRVIISYEDSMEENASF